MFAVIILKNGSHRFYNAGLCRKVEDRMVCVCVYVYVCVCVVALRPR